MPSTRTRARVNQAQSHRTELAGRIAAQAVDNALGPSWADLNPGGTEDRTSLYFTPNKPALNPKTYIRCDPWNVGIEDGNNSDFWSTTGQVAYVPDAPTINYSISGTTYVMNNPGCDRVQTYAYYDGVFATSPRLDPTGNNHPELFLYQQAEYRNTGQIACMVRNYCELTNEAIGVTQQGVFVIMGTQTSQSDRPWPYPILRFPQGKVPTSISLSTCNEFAFVTIQDTNTGQGQVAVVALEAKYLEFHTWPYLGLLNQGVWSDFVLLGYIDLPFNYPTTCDAATNAFWSGPSQTVDNTAADAQFLSDGVTPNPWYGSPRGGLVISQVNLANPKYLGWVRDGTTNDWSWMVAKSGYLIVGSKTEQVYSVYDLTPLVQYFRTAWLSNYTATVAARAARTFPSDFVTTPAMAPTIVNTFTTTTPLTKVLAGKQIDRWSPDRHKAHIAAEDGTITILDTSTYMKRWSWETIGTLAVMGTFIVGANPTDLVPYRFLHAMDGISTLFPAGTYADGNNNIFYVVCRGSRRIDFVATYRGHGETLNMITDPVLVDPVAACTADRGPVLCVCDFLGKQLVSFRTASVTNKTGTRFPIANGNGDSVELSGVLPLPGFPFAINNANVN